jgi:hypothetical protein
MHLVRRYILLYLVVEEERLEELKEELLEEKVQKK